MKRIEGQVPWTRETRGIYHVFPASTALGLAAAIAVMAVPAMSGCAHYYLPATHLESPEARGKPGVGRLEAITFLSGTDLNAKGTVVTPPPPPPPDPEDPGNVEQPSPPYLQAQSTWANYVFGLMVALSEEFEIGTRFGPFLPLSIRGKYQLHGKPESQSAPGDFSLAFAGSGGFLAGSEGAQGNTTYLLFDASLPAGYRISKSHLISLVPFFSIASLSGLYSTPQSANQLGVGLGYQYSVDELFLRLELSKASGSFGDATIAGEYGEMAIGGFFGGALIGLRL